MKTKKILAFVLALMAVLACFVACSDEEAEPSETEALWESAIYKEDATVGEGEKTITVSVEALDKKITLTVKTDSSDLGDALYSLGLINDPAFFDVANGMKADWDADKAYWGFYIGDKMAPYGVNDEKISSGNRYRLVYTK